MGELKIHIIREVSVDIYRQETSIVVAKETYACKSVLQSNISMKDGLCAELVRYRRISKGIRMVNHASCEVLSCWINHPNIFHNNSV